MLQRAPTPQPSTANREQVHVAYQTSGNIAVWDEDALRHAEFAAQVRARLCLCSRPHDFAAQVWLWGAGQNPARVRARLLSMPCIRLRTRMCPWFGCRAPPLWAPLEYNLCACPCLP